LDLAAKGGETMKEAIMRMITALFTNSLVRQMNWSGRGGDDDDDLDGEEAQVNVDPLAFLDNEHRKIPFRLLKCWVAILSKFDKWFNRFRFTSLQLS
jgi:hypothetical protein